jgi:hypothetical protein
MPEGEEQANGEERKPRRKFPEMTMPSECQQKTKPNLNPTSFPFL